MKIGARILFYPASETECFIKNSSTRFIFVQDADGRITGLRVIPRAGMIDELRRIRK